MTKFLISLIPFILYMVLKYRKSIYMLQQNSYNVSNRYIKWIFKNLRKSFITYDIIIFIILLLASLLFNNLIIYIMGITYFTCFYVELKLIKREQQKKKFAITSRVKRLYFTLFILFTIHLFYIQAFHLYLHMELQMILQHQRSYH